MHRLTWAFKGTVLPKIKNGVSCLVMEISAVDISNSHWSKTCLHLLTVGFFAQQERFSLLGEPESNDSAVDADIYQWMGAE